MAMLHSDNAYSHTDGRFGYSDADWKFNMGTKARNAFWMSENKQTTYLLNMCFGSRWQRQQERILKWDNIGIIFIYTGGCLSPNIHFLQRNFKREIYKGPPLS
jgi:hypothetical protein